MPPLNFDCNNYTKSLDQKTSSMKEQLQQILAQPIDPEIYSSKPEHYRMRSEFAIFHTQDSFDYVMFKANTKPKQRIIIENFKVHAKVLDDLMPLLKHYICGQIRLKKLLFEIDFLASSHDEVIIALGYHRRLEDDFAQDLKALQQYLRSQGFKVDIIARARKQCFVADKDYLIEEYKLQGKILKLKQIEGSFTQPNYGTCCHMLDFACSCAQELKGRDLLELYCGSGTFTLALAPYFRQVLATEVTRTATRCALENIVLNKITNTKIVRLSALEVGEALNSVRPFKRLQEQEIDLGSYNFDCLFIDPPRQGLDSKAALDFTAQFDNIIYISCGKESFLRDLASLTTTHEVVKLAFFDQFPYTDHLENGAWLRKRT